jgi:quercetin dioxygenase-like cupin family protein
MEIRRFGPGNRRPTGPAGTQGLTGQVIWSDERANISELAFSRNGVITPHTNPNTTLFVVISGGGFVQVGNERIRINHGEAVVWPPDVPHGAYTEGSEMRAIVVELPESPVIGAIPPDVPEAEPTIEAAQAPSASLPPSPPAPEPARGALADRPIPPSEHDESQGEPW